MLAMVPWQIARRGVGGSGVEFVLGEYSPAPPADELPDELREPDLGDQARLALDVLASQTEERSDDPLLIASSALADGRVSGSVAGGQAADWSSPQQARTPSGGEPQFETFISQLRKEGLDIAITFDSTGSMQGEIDQVKSQIERIGRILKRLVPSVRISVCSYRDTGDEYVVKGIPLTEDLAAIAGFLSEVRAGGGGDEPEAVDEGLRWVIENNQFRESARKVILLFGDAPPHYNRQTECLRLAAEFRRRGGIVSTVTCRQERRLVPLAEIAQLGGGEAFLTRDNREIMARLVVLVFGSRYRQRVLELFEMDLE